MSGQTPDIPTENLQKLTSAERQIREMKLYDLSLLAESLATAFLTYAEDFDVLTAISLVREQIPFPIFPMTDDALPENRKLLSLGEALGTLPERAALSSYFIAALEKRQRFLSEGDFFPQETVKRRIAYVAEPLSEEAFAVFSDEFGEFSPLPTSSAKDAVSALEAGDAGFCLLPFEEARGRRVCATEDTIFTNELKIVAVTPVYGYGGDADCKYALLSDTLSVFPYSREDDRYLEVHLPQDEAIGFLDPICRYLDYSVAKMQSFVYENTTYYSAVLKSEGQSFLPALVYFSLFCPDVTFVGMYKNLET